MRRLFATATMAANNRRTRIRIDVQRENVSRRVTLCPIQNPVRALLHGSAALLAIAERFPNVYCSVGTHPHYAHTELDIPVSEIVALSRHPKVVAIGEAFGLA